MPKSPAATLAWFPERRAYQLHTADQPLVWIEPDTKEAWFAWLTAHTSFSFQGQHGNLNVYKELRARGTGYWYAYHTHAGQIRKRYLGGSETVTLVRLEEVAQDLQEGRQKLSPQPSHLPASSAALNAAPGRKEVLASSVQPGHEINDSGSMLVMTRLSPPRLPATLVVRERLLTTLDTALSHPLTLLSASAGWGKTTLLSAWAHRHQEAVAWLSLEALDNGPTRFWTSLITALRRCWPELGERASALLQVPGSLSAGLTILLNELATRSAETSPLMLILDDYHVIDEPAIHTSLTFWIEHLPSHVHLVLASRVDPDLPLARFRARGHLFEIRDTDLRFTQKETQHFLIERMGLALEDHDVERVEAHTEGWIASLHLTALFLQRHPDPSAGVHRLCGSQRFFLDYLREEILASLSEELQVFLLQTSWLNPLSASLCDAVRGKEDSAHLLEQVERANLFLQPLDEHRQWYRYHALWAQVMQHEAQRRLGAATVCTLRSKASLWYEQQQLLPEAIEAALASEEFARAAILIGQCMAPNSYRNEYHLLCSWLRRLPEKMLQIQPELSFLYALALTFTTDRRSPATWVRVALFLQWAEQGFEATEQWEKRGEALQLQAELAFFQDDPRMFVLAHQAQPHLTEHSLLYPENLLLRGLAALLAGEMQMAWQCFLEGYRRAKNLDNYSATFAASLLLGEVCLEKGELRRASRHFHQALVLFEEDQELSRQQLLLETGNTEPFFVSWVYHSLAHLSYEHNELADARRSVSQALALRAKPEEGVHLLASGAFIQARLLYASGETAQAQDLLSQWEVYIHSSWSLSAIRTCRVRLSLAEGDLSTVEQWAQEKAHPFGSLAPEYEGNLPLLRQQEEALLLARLHIAQKRGETALQELAIWKEQAQAQGRTRSVLEIQILEALAYATCQKQSQASASLFQAVRLAYAENAQRLFLDEGSAMECLLKTLLPELREASLISFVRTLLRAFAQEDGSLHAKDTSNAEQPLLIEPLSSQEQRVLRLLVTGRSNPEIARELVISLNTVKTHIQSLYGKLHVHNRVEASEVARRLSLL